MAKIEQFFRTAALTIELIFFHHWIPPSANGGVKCD
jgi:hypothetical protein